MLTADIVKEAETLKEEFFSYVRSSCCLCDAPAFQHCFNNSPLQLLNTDYIDLVVVTWHHSLTSKISRRYGWACVKSTLLKRMK